MLPNCTLRDNRLSLKTRAILAIMFSLPEDWDYTAAGLSTICGAGRDAVRSALRELEKFGYLTRVQRHDESGHFGRNEYIVTDEPAEGWPLDDTAVRSPETDEPLTGFPSADEPSAGEPLTDNPTQQNKDCTNTPYSPPDGTARRAAGKKRAAKAAPDWKPDRFAGFWDYYPRGESKQAAIRAWDRLRPDDGLIDRMAQALRRQMDSANWQAGFGIPYASTWLNNRRWEDVEKTPPQGMEPPDSHPLRGEGVQYL